MSEFILDVGCGTNPCGTVNCDFTVKDELKHRGYISEEIEPKNIQNFILCDASHLPFKKETFDKVICKQVIEHINNPSLLFNELVRVSKDKIIIETTHYRAERLVRSHLLKRRNTIKWHQQHHINFFSFKSLNRAIQKYNCKLIRSYTLSTLKIPNNYLCILELPFEIGVEFKKMKK